MNPRSASPNRSNLSSAKLLALIELMSELEEPARLGELAQALEMSPSTVHRFLATLQQCDYVAQDQDDGRYFLTFKLCGIADNIHRSQTMVYVATPFLRQLAEVFGESANLCVESNLLVMYNAVVPGKPQSLVSMHYIGHIAPMHCTAAGKLMLSGYNEKRLDRFLRLKGLPRLTPHTLTTKEALLAEVEQIRQQGYAYDNEECELGVRCVAAPVYDNQGRLAAGLSVSGPLVRMSDSHIQTHLPVLLEKAAQLSARLGQKAEVSGER